MQNFNQNPNNNQTNPLQLESKQVGENQIEIGTSDGRFYVVKQENDLLGFYLNGQLDSRYFIHTIAELKTGLTLSFSSITNGKEVGKLMLWAKSRLSSHISTKTCDNCDAVNSNADKQCRVCGNCLYCVG